MAAKLGRNVALSALMVLTVGVCLTNSGLISGTVNDLVSIVGSVTQGVGDLTVNLLANILGLKLPLTDTESNVLSGIVTSCKSKTPLTVNQTATLLSILNVNSILDLNQSTLLKLSAYINITQVHETEQSISSTVDGVLSLVGSVTQKVGDLTVDILAKVLGLTVPLTDAVSNVLSGIVASVKSGIPLSVSQVTSLLSILNVDSILDLPQSTLLKLAAYINITQVYETEQCGCNSDNDLLSIIGSITQNVGGLTVNVLAEVLGLTVPLTDAISNILTGIVSSCRSGTPLTVNQTASLLSILNVDSILDLNQSTLLKLAVYVNITQVYETEQSISGTVDDLLSVVGSVTQKVEDLTVNILAGILGLTVPLTDAVSNLLSGIVSTSISGAALTVGQVTSLLSVLKVDSILDLPQSTLLELAAYINITQVYETDQCGCNTY